jgi:hypothetical protein
MECMWAKVMEGREEGREEGRMNGNIDPIWKVGMEGRKERQ